MSKPADSLNSDSAQLSDTGSGKLQWMVLLVSFFVFVCWVGLLIYLAVAT